MFENFKPRRVEQKQKYVQDVVQYFSKQVEHEKELNFMSEKDFDFLGHSALELKHTLELAYLNFFVGRGRFDEEELKVISKSNHDYDEKYSRILIHDDGGNLFKFKLKNDDYRYVLVDHISQSSLFFKKNTDLKKLLEAIKLMHF